MILRRRLLARRLQDLLPVLFLGLLGLFAIWPWIPRPGKAAPVRTVVFYGFSILGEVMNEGIFPAFQAEWEARHGERVEFVSSFAGSGTVTNQLIMGVPADLALLSLELDALRLSEAGITPAYSWRKLPYEGIVNRTPFVILARPGNPLQIRGFEDLTQPGIGVVHPDPLTSGGANWAIIAEYGAGVRAHPQEPQAGTALLRGLWRNVVAQAASARAARTQFDNGFGDVLITYEQEALWDRMQGQLRSEIIYPPHTILSEHTLVVIDHNIDPSEREIVGAFVDFLWSEKGQRIFAAYGFRSVYEEINEENPHFGEIEDPFFIGDFGGWAQAKRDIVDTIWKAQILGERTQ